MNDEFAIEDVSNDPFVGGHALLLLSWADLHNLRKACAICAERAREAGNEEAALVMEDLAASMDAGIRAVESS